MSEQIIPTASPEETFAVARAMGEKALQGEVYALSGDLGTGKTVFAKGFAAGLGIAEPITSPTFTIVCEYETGRLPLYHFDVYRIEDVEELCEVGIEDYIRGDGVCLIEWAEKISELLPPEVRHITIEKTDAHGPDARCIRIEAQGQRV